MIYRVLSALRRTGRITVERPRSALWTLFALTCAMLAIGVAALVAVNIDRWSAAPPPAASSTANMVVYLGDDVTEARAIELLGDLRKLPGIERAELVTQAESSKRLAQALGDDKTLLEGIDLSSLPASIEIQLAAGVQDVVAMSPTVRALRGSPGVTDVVEQPLLAVTAPPTESNGAVRAIAWTSAALLAGLALLVVLALVRVRLERDRQEVAVANLLGASPSFIVVPTALAGALSCALAAILAAIALAIGLDVWGDSLARMLERVEPVAPAFGQLALLVGLGAVLGLVGGGLAGASRVAR